MTAAAPHAQPLAGRRVLIVEDQYLIAEEMSRLVRGLGGVVIGPAPGPAAARRLFEDVTPDVALLDINLHGEQVWEIAQELFRRGVRLIFATGYEAAALRSPFEAAIHIDKPVTARDFAEAVSRLGLKPD